MGLRGRSLFENDWLVSFVTTTVMNLDNVFSLNDKHFDILAESLNFLLQKFNAGLVSYVFMPNHIHTVIHIRSGKHLSALMRDFKKFTSFKIRQQLEQDLREDVLCKLRINAKNQRTTKFKLWKDRFDDIIIYNERTLKIKIDYIHLNPVKKGLVKNPEDWKYSSFRNYYCGDESILKVDYI